MLSSSPEVLFKPSKMTSPQKLFDRAMTMISDSVTMTFRDRGHIYNTYLSSKKAH